MRRAIAARILAGMDPVVELRRQLNNVLRFGTIAEVDHRRAVCRVRSGQLLSDWVPWLVPRAGDAVEWSAPTVGEQVLLLSPNGDTLSAVVLRGIYSNAHGAPSTEDSQHCVRYPDGALIAYDHVAHSLTATLPSGGTATLTADGGVTIHGPLTVNGNTQINGTATASIDVIGAGISLKNHTHGGVQSGGASTGAPQ